MKKSLLIAAAIMMTAGANAQVEKVHKSNADQLPMMLVQKTIKTTAEKKNAPRKVKSNGVYYTRPYGSYYSGADPFTNIWWGGRSTIVVPPFVDITFNNLSTGVTSWTNTQNEVMQEDGDYTTSFHHISGNAFFVPTLTSRAGSYYLGEYNVYVKRDLVSGTTNGLVICDSISPMWAADPCGAYLSDDGQYYSPYSTWGVLDNDNLFGSGNFVQGDNTYVSYGASQVFEEPMSPLYATSIVISALCPKGSQPIAEGDTLHAYITGVRESTKEYSDGSTEDVIVADLDNILVELQCTSADTLDFVSTATRNQKTCQSGSLVFRHMGEPDAFGNASEEPFLVNQQFAVVFTNFNQEGVDCGLYGLDAFSENGDDERCQNAELLLLDSKGNILSLNYTNPMVLDACINGMFDIAIAPKQPQMYTFEDESLDYSIVRVPEEGSTDEYGYGNCTDGATASAFLTGNTTDTGYPGAPVYTATEWFDTDGEVAFYEILEEDLPDWIQGYSVDNSIYGDTGGLNIVMFFADPLPEGVEGRYADVHVVGRPVIDGEKVVYSATSERIRIIQGNPTIEEVPTAIRNVETSKSNNNMLYNLNGQRVNAHQRGIMINNGKKFIVK